MNYNVTTYGLYLIITVYVIVVVGNILYKNGRPFLINVFHGNVSLADSINNILITGYYLVNIGYCIIALKVWKQIDSLQELLEIEGSKIGGIVLMLGLMHLINITILFFTEKKYRKANNDN